MTCDELRDHYELYALGIADEPERGEIAQHLEENCPNCVPGIRRALAFNSLLLAEAPDAAPPERLRTRVLASVGIERGSTRRYLRWAPALAGLALFAAWAGYRQHETSRELDAARRTIQSERAELIQARGEAQAVRSALQLLSDPDTRQVGFGKEDQRPPRGQLLVNGQKGIALIAANLPPVPAGKVYEMWLVPRTGGGPVPAGLFAPLGNGMAVHSLPGPVGVATLAAVAVSVEPSGGSAAPTTTPVLVIPTKSL